MEEFRLTARDMELMINDITKRTITDANDKLGAYYDEKLNKERNAWDIKEYAYKEEVAEMKSKKHGSDVRWGLSEKKRREEEEAHAKEVNHLNNLLKAKDNQIKTLEANETLSKKVKALHKDVKDVKLTVENIKEHFDNVKDAEKAIKAQCKNDPTVSEALMPSILKRLRAKF